MSNYSHDISRSDSKTTGSYSLSASKKAQEILNEIKTGNSSVLDNLDEADVIRLKNSINPYNVEFSSEKNAKWLNISITHLNEKYLTRLLMTAFIGFLNRACDEWRVPESVPVVPVYEYLEDCEKNGGTSSKLDDLENKNESEERKEELEFNKKWMEKRIIVKEFLEDIFQYDPDIHVRTAYNPNITEPDVRLVNTPATQIGLWGLKREMKQEKNKIYKNKLRKVIQEYETRKNADEKYRMTDKTDPETEMERDCYRMIPSHDIFFKIHRYYENNYENIRRIVNNLYCISPLLETATFVYGVHNTKEEALEFVRTNSDSFKTDVLTIRTGAWFLHGPFKENREGVNIFNKKTRILEKILDRIEEDSKLGTDLMNKRVKVAKVKNIIQEGCDHKDLDTYKSTLGMKSSLGEIKLQEELTPNDAIEVPVFKISKGGLGFEKEKFFSKAEANMPDDETLLLNNRTISDKACLTASEGFTNPTELSFQTTTPIKEEEEKND